MSGRVLNSENPFPPVPMPGYPLPEGFTVRWIWHPTLLPGDASILAFRLPFAVDEEQSVRIHVSADQRYELFFDGERLGRGPQRGDLAHWFFETYELDLTPGEHLLSARVWWLPDDGPPMAQISAAPGFVVFAEGSLNQTISTGAGDWEVMAIRAYRREDADLAAYRVVGWSLRVDGQRFPWGWQSDAELLGTWVPASPCEIPVGPGHPGYDTDLGTRNPTHHLLPATLPPMLEVPHSLGLVRHAERIADETRIQAILPEEHDAALAEAFQKMLRGKQPLTLPPNQHVRVIVDLEDYYCGYPELTVTGGTGAQVAIAWAESLFESPDPRSHVKGHRDCVDGKYFRGAADRFLIAGGAHRTYDTLWWRSGRYLEVRVHTGTEPLSIERLGIRETRYPLEMEATFEADDAELVATIPVMFRTLQMCAHETYMDCPYYEQLMYVGDTRLQVLVTYLTSSDDRLPTTAIDLFDWSRSPDGLTKSRYPSAVPQVIPPFSLWWVGMVHDHFLWRNGSDQVLKWLPGVDAVLRAYERYVNSDGLVGVIPGWNYCDWVPEWNAGWPPNAHDGPNALINLMYLYALDRAGEMHAYYGQRALTDHWCALSERIRPAIVEAFWDEERKLLADDPSHAHYSEHVQSLAILTHLFRGDPRERQLIDGLLHAPGLSQTTIYFSHYLFEALTQIGAMDALFARLSLWKALLHRGFKTTLESPEPSRSDCHAWGAHPLYHLFASVLGARPASPGFRSIRICPQPGPLSWLRGSFPHPDGEMVRFDLRVSGARISGEIVLPAGLDGVLVWQGTEMHLSSGSNDVRL